MAILFPLAVLLFSVVIHEVAHGYAAKAQGDNTAEYMGRLTLNPLPHLDTFGSVILPLTMYLLARLSGGPVLLFGWAKPVPYNPFNLRNIRWGPAIVAFAGPAANISIAVLFGAVVRVFAGIDAMAALIQLFGVIIYLNLVLAFFNLIPLPPLDGSKLLFAIIPERMRGLQQFLEQYGWMLFLLFIFLGLPLFQPIIAALFRMLTGNSISF